MAYILSLTEIPWWYFLIEIGIVIVLVLTTKKWDFSLLAGYMFLVFAYTVLMRTPQSTHKVADVPFWSYLALFGLHQSPVPFKRLLMQMIANILMFIPIGLFAGSIFRWKGIIIGVVFSVCIELLQLFGNLGLFEFDDIFHNSLGAAIGVSLICA